MKKIGTIILFILFAGASYAQNNRDTILLKDADHLREHIKCVLEQHRAETDSLNHRIAFLEHQLDSMMELSVKSKKTKPASVSPATLKRLGELAAGIIVKAKLINIYTVYPEKRQELRKDDTAFVAGYGIKGRVISVGIGLTVLARNIALDPQTYQTTALPSKCAFFPYLDLQFVNGRHNADLLVCFSCNEFQLWVDGKAVASGDIGNGRNALLSLGRTAFPDDQTLQHLK